MWRAWERRENCTRFWWESPKESDLLEDRAMDGIRMNIRGIGWEDGEWVQLAQDRGQWRTFENMVINLRVLAPRI
jgi:hypothetical protein